MHGNKIDCKKAKEKEVEPEDNGEGECESWCEVADSRRKGRRAIFYSFTASYLRYGTVPLKLRNQNNRKVNTNL